MLAGGQQVTYEELDRHSIQGSQLFRKPGVNTGDGIAVWLPNHSEFLKITWAAQRSGLYYTPISTYFQTSEVAHILGNSDAQLLITTQHLLDKLDEIPKALMVLLIDDASPFETSWQKQRAKMPTNVIADESEGAEMIYSSGTTGQPKGVRFPLSEATYGTVSSTLNTRIKMHQIGADTKYLSTAPLYHSAPLRYNMIVTRLGGTTFVMEKFDAEQALSAIQDQQITHSQWVPTMFVRLLKLPPEVRASYQTNSLRYVIHAAAPCPIDIKQQMLDWLGPIVYEYYSGTEANGFTAISPEEWLGHPGSVGTPLNGQIHFLDEALQELGPNHTGTIYFSGGNDFSYYKDPEKTAAAKTNSGLSTLGDIGYLDEEGYLYLKDRKSFMIISGGVNIYPQEIEDLLISHPGVADVAVFGVPNQEFGEEVKAVIQPSLEVNTSEQELMVYCRENLSPIKCPRSIEFMTELPRHPTGKLYKQALKAHYW